MCSSDMKFDYKKALAQLNISEREVSEMREKIKNFKHVPDTISDKKLLCFLNACNGIDDAVNVISIYYNIRQTCPSIFFNRDPLSNEIQQCLENQYYFHLPNTPSGCSLIYHCLSNNKASNYIFDEACKTFFMTIDSLLCTRGPSKGLIILFDMRNVGYKHLLRPSVEGLKYFFRYLQDALPARLEAMHIVNCVSFFDIVLTMIKPFTSAAILNKIHLHPPGMDLQKFHKEWIPRQCLPSDFGGQLDSAVNLHKAHCSTLVNLRDFFIEDEQETKSKIL